MHFDEKAKLERLVKQLENIADGMTAINSTLVEIRDRLPQDEAKCDFLIGESYLEELWASDAYKEAEAARIAEIAESVDE